MHLNLKEENLKQGVLGLVIVLVEIIRDVLKLQALRRMENSLSDEEIERLGLALKELDKAIEEIKIEQGINETVNSVRKELDNLVNNLINKVIEN
ncbi:MAG: gas vesicle protein K [Armatimonadetes bacterium]|nr:gas vesicle protein K [Armatimonadota bacterium]